MHVYAGKLPQFMYRKCFLAEVCRRMPGRTSTANVGVDQMTSTHEQSEEGEERDQTCGGRQVCVLGTHGARAEAERPLYASSPP